jgi:hypothetical protein
LLSGQVQSDHSDVAYTHIAATCPAPLQGLSGLDQLLLPQAGEGASGLQIEQQQQLVRMLTEDLERLMSLGTGDWAAALQELQQQQQQQELQQQQQEQEQQEQPRHLEQEQQQTGPARAAEEPSQGTGAGTGAAVAGNELAAGVADGAARQQQLPEVKQEEGSNPLLRGRGRRKRLLSRSTSGIQGMEGVEHP